METPNPLRPDGGRREAALLAEARRLSAEQHDLWKWIEADTASAAARNSPLFRTRLEKARQIAERLSAIGGLLQGSRRAPTALIELKVQFVRRGKVRKKSRVRISVPASISGIQSQEHPEIFGHLLAILGGALHSRPLLFGSHRPAGLPPRRTTEELIGALKHRIGHSVTAGNLRVLICRLRKILDDFDLPNLGIDSTQGYQLNAVVVLIDEAPGGHAVSRSR